MSVPSQIAITERIRAGDTWAGLVVTWNKSGLDFTGATVACALRADPLAAPVHTLSLTPVFPATGQCRVTPSLAAAVTATLPEATLYGDVVLTHPALGTITAVTFALEVHPWGSPAVTDPGVSGLTVNLNVAPQTVTVTLADTVGVPPGGTVDQVLTKTGPGPQDQAWRDNNVGTLVTNAMAEHVNAVDPHPQYTTAGEAAAAAPVQSVAGRAGAVTLGTGDIAGLVDQLSAKADLVAGKVPVGQLPDGLGAVESVNGQTGAVMLVKADLGLANAENTADLAKPISSATQAALDTKAAAADLADLAGAVALTGSAGPLRGSDGFLLFGPRPAVGTIAGLAELLAAKSDTGHTHAIADTTGLQAALDGKAATGHTHAQSEVTGLTAALAAKSDTGHTHAIADTTGLQAALDGKAATGHTHAIADTTGLQAALDGKAATGHNHDSAYVPKQRYQTLFIPAGAMTPATTAGAAAATKEAPTNKQNYDVFAFDGASAESVWFVVRMPDLWDLGTLKVVFHWTPDTGGTGAAVFGLCAVAVSNDDAIDVAPGTEVTVADSVLAVGDVHTTAATSAMTVGGTPALGDLVFFKVRRIPTDAGDTMTQDALLLGLTLQWRESATEASAW